MKTIHIDAVTIPDLWFQAVNSLIDNGRKFKIDKGSYEGQTRLEFDYFTGFIKCPFYGSGTPEILPQIPAHLNVPNPVEFNYVYGGIGYERSYIEYIMTAEKQPNEAYTYGSRLRAYPFHISSGIEHLDQVEHVIKSYKKFGHRNNQMVLQVGVPDDLMLDDPACLRHIQCKIQDGKLHFIIYFRSWDLWCGASANLAGIEFLQNYMSSEIGVEQGSFIVSSAGLHIYGYAEDFAKIRCNK